MYRYFGTVKQNQYGEGFGDLAVRKEEEEEESVSKTTTQRPIGKLLNQSLRARPARSCIDNFESSGKLIATDNTATI